MHVAPAIGVMWEPPHQQHDVGAMRCSASFCHFPSLSTVTIPRTWQQPYRHLSQDKPPTHATTGDTGSWSPSWAGACLHGNSAPPHLLLGGQPKRAREFVGLVGVQRDPIGVSLLRPQVLRTQPLGSHQCTVQSMAVVAQTRQPAGTVNVSTADA